MKKQNIVQSFNSAIEGFIYVVKTQRNMRLHFLIAILAILLGIYLNLSKTETLILLLTICFVIVSEMLNTAIEMGADLISDRYNPMVRITKDIAAGCVFVASINAFIVGYLLFLCRAGNIDIAKGLARIKCSPWHITLIILILVMFLVIAGKVLFHKGTPLRGGMPSGHAAVAFSLWMTIYLFSANQLVAVLALILAVLVARSRLSGKIHTIGEVLAGAAVGTLVPLLIFQILR